jgi:hypothetical protein
MFVDIATAEFLVVMIDLWMVIVLKILLNWIDKIS